MVYRLCKSGSISLFDIVHGFWYGIRECNDHRKALDSINLLAYFHVAYVFVCKKCDVMLYDVYIICYRLI